MGPDTHDVQQLSNSWTILCSYVTFRIIPVMATGEWNESICPAGRMQWLM